MTNWDSDHTEHVRPTPMFFSLCLLDPDAIHSFVKPYCSSNATHNQLSISHSSYTQAMNKAAVNNQITSIGWMNISSSLTNYSTKADKPKAFTLSHIDWKVIKWSGPMWENEIVAGNSRSIYFLRLIICIQHFYSLEDICQEE